MEIDTDINLETKAGPSAEALAMHDAFMRAFEEYKATNDDRVSQIERRGAADPLTEDKQARIDGAIARRFDRQQQQIDELMLKDARPGLARDGAGASALAARERKAAFEAYVRRGDSAALRELETKALSVGSGPDGGYLVPPEVEHAIGRRLAAISPIRSLASVRTVSATVYKKPFMTSGPAVGWVGETDARPQTASPTLDELTFPVMELYAMPAATATLLEDAAVNIDEWIASEVDLAFATQESAAFVAGDGVKKPKGFLSYTKIADASWAWTKIGYVATGQAGAWPASNPSDVLVDLVYALKAGYRQNGAFVMNRKTQSAIRKFKDATGHYLWQPPAQVGGRATLLGFPVAESEDMPDIGADASGDRVQRWWRPVYALELILECVAVWIVALADLKFNGGKISAFVLSAQGLLTTYWTARFGVLGVYVGGRSIEKLAGVAGGFVDKLSPSVIDQIVKAVRRK